MNTSKQALPSRKTSSRHSWMSAGCWCKWAKGQVPEALTRDGSASNPKNCRQCFSQVSVFALPQVLLQSVGKAAAGIRLLLLRLLGACLEVPNMVQSRHLSENNLQAIPSKLREAVMLLTATAHNRIPGPTECKLLSGAPGPAFSCSMACTACCTPAS